MPGEVRKPHLKEEGAVEEEQQDKHQTSTSPVLSLKFTRSAVDSGRSNQDTISWH